MVTVGIVIPKLWLSDLRAEQLDFNPRRKLVVIQLAGGNDGFNTVVPYTDPRYYSLRPMLALRETDLRTKDGVSTIISDKFGLHPALAELKQLYDSGRVAAVLGVGYPNPNLSHFLSMDIWHTANLNGLGNKGWLGKYADLALIGQPNLAAASIGSLELPKSLGAERFVVPNIINFELYNFLADPNYPGDYNNQVNTFNFAASRAMSAGSFLSTVNSTAFESVRGAQQVQQSVNAYQSTVSYPANNPLAVGLRMVAQLMTTVPETTLLYVQMGGFDNHSDQIGDRQGDRGNRLAGDHSILLRWFSEAVKLFHDDLTEHGLADDVVMLQWSEFGRRLEENASFGTDHGSAASIFVIGNPVRGGIYGEQPSMAATELDPAGNVQFKVDFREVYATILDRWLGADSRAVLGAQYSNLGLFE